jgi:hypothetical protein
VGIRVAPRAADTLEDCADGFALQVTGADDPSAAAPALVRLRDHALSLSSHSPEDPAGPVVAGPVMAPGGPLMRIARLGAPIEEVVELAHVLADHLEALGVTEATVSAPPPGGRLDGLDACASAVVLRLFPSPDGAAGVLPPSWLDVAGEWVLGDLAPSSTVPVRLLAIEYEVPVADAVAIIHQSAQARAWCDLVQGDLSDRVRTASVTFGRAPHLALAAGGPGCDSAALLARYGLLVEVARELAAEVTYACLDIEPTFEGIGLGVPTSGWRARGGASPNVVAGRLCDILVPDVFPYQVLGKGHLDRLEPSAGAPHDLDDPPVGDPIGHGRIEVQVGDPAAWLPIHDTRAEAVAHGEELLGRLLATDEEVAALLADRPGTQGRTSPGPQPPSDWRPAVDGVPDLDAITLGSVPHPRRGLHLTLLELVSWLAGEPHSDAPRTCSPVLATYARWFASALDDEDRQVLKPLARSLVRTADPVPAGSPPGALSPHDQRRVWLATDWLVRVQAPAWFEAAGLTDAASRLTEMGPVTDHRELVRAVDVLAGALTIAARRIDITTSIAGADDPDAAGLVDQAAWEAWDRLAERSGWVAASEAAGTGIPPGLAYATDLRVIECARDTRARDELEATSSTVGDAAWSAALHATADEAWTAGWRAAEQAIDAVARLDLDTALDRARLAAGDRAGLDPEALDAAVDAADAAARDSLTQAALRRDPAPADRHPWDDALAAARRSPGGEVWATVQRLAREAVEEGPWQAGTTAARAAVDSTLGGAPDLVSRTVVGAVAREAASSAGRGVALRAAAVARAQGSDEQAVMDAAVDALAPTVGQLQAAAVDLLTRLVDPTT